MFVGFHKLQMSSKAFSIAVQYLLKHWLRESGTNGTLFFKRLAFPYFSAELVRSNLIKKKKNLTFLLYFSKLMQHYRKKVLKI
jgi:hypothetical protein